MHPALTIGEFSRVTHLSVKTLRHYHEVDLLLPAEVDPHTGYRYYRTTQVPTAQVIRRFRDLGMPVEEVRAVLVAADPAARTVLIAGHLKRLEDQLEATQAAVASLRSLIEQPVAPISVERRTVGATAALAITETVERGELGEWWAAAFDELAAALRRGGVEPGGLPGGLFSNELFEDDIGSVTAFIPTAPSGSGVGRARSIVIGPAELAVTVHRGSHAEIDRTYGALGSHVAEHAIGFGGPVRETYVVSRLDTADATRWETEIGWPIFGTAVGHARTDAPVGP
ncbi:MAG TPA: MerR family transcriptional regulator [Solirubrobacteraceae bacterium]|nr:MerR family transcriptional regulator [Solirubrobacteraceae bacterium]